MSSVDPTGVATLESEARAGRLSKTTVAEPRAEKRQTPPEDRKADRTPPATAPSGKDGSSAISGAFGKHPVATGVCLALIVAALITGIIWYLHARHYEST